MLNQSAAPVTLKQGKEEIDNYLKCVNEFQKCGKVTIRPGQYMACYNCIVKLSDETDNAADLYIIYKKKLDDKTKSYLSNLRAVIGDSKLFLRKFSEQWKNFTTFLVCLQKMFHYLDRYYLKNGAEKSMTLTETALSIWKSKIFDEF